MADLTDAQIAELQDLIVKSRQSSGPVETTPQVTPQSAQPSGFSVKIGGQDYAVRDQGEAQRLLDQLEAQRAQEIQAERIRAEALQQQQERLQSAFQPGGRTQGDTFDKEEYARLFLTDPRQAQKYMILNDPEQQAFYRGLVSKIEEVKQENAASQFLLQHKDDYVATPANFQALQGLMSQYNLRWDINGMNLAYYVASASGALETSGGGTQGAQAQQPEEETFVPVPRVSRRKGGAAQSENDEIIANFANLSVDAQKKYLESISQ